VTRAREPDVAVSDANAASSESINRCARRGRVAHALSRSEAADIVTAHQPWIPDIEREDARIVRIATVAAVVHRTHRERVEVRRHEIAAIVRQEAGEV